MHCYICDAVMAPEELDYDRRYEKQRFGPYPPCRSCLTLIDEVFTDPLTEEEIDWLLQQEDVAEIVEESISYVENEKIP